jgi:hypothetical protein
VARRYGVILFGVGVALAGATNPSQADEAPRSVASSLQINVSTSVTLLGSTATPDEEMALAGQARATIYKMAAGECALIVQTLGGKCVLQQIQVNAHDLNEGQYGGNPMARQGVSAQGNFSYRLTQ